MKTVYHMLCFNTFSATIIRHGPIHVFQNIVIYDTFLRNITIFTIFAIPNTGALSAGVCRYFSCYVAVDEG